jgi:acyl-CoA reductase-like NAD-dependent aldehyde dehydrogenase
LHRSSIASLSFTVSNALAVGFRVLAGTGREVTNQFMRHPDVAFILATGGMNMVRAA